ncbi:MAG: hypothetical protein JO021_00435 [Alphaproteobacteria bacterium]|nr:hypothetical protein [Alphaproteobacteria bacterium]
MAIRVPPKRTPERGDPAVEEARQWNRDLRHSVSTAKGHAQALRDSRRGYLPDTPKRPCMTDAELIKSKVWRDRSEEYRAFAEEAQSPEARRAYAEVSRSCATIAERLERFEAATLQKPAQEHG